MLSVTKSKNMQIVFACILGAIILLLPRPEGTRFKISGDNNRLFYETIKDRYSLIDAEQPISSSYSVEVCANRQRHLHQTNTCSIWPRASRMASFKSTTSMVCLSRPCASWRFWPY